MAKKVGTVEVVVHNDDETSMEMVALVLTGLFDVAETDAGAMTLQIHNEGQRVVGSFELQTARRKIELAKLAAKGAKCPLRCSIKGEDVYSEEDRVPKTDAIPKGWIKAGAAPADYRVLVEKGIAHSGSQCASMQNAVAAPAGFGTLMSTFGTEDYAGKRLRMRLFVKSEREGSSVSPWMRVDGPDAGAGKSLAFDNWCERSIIGQTDWAECVSVLDVPENATNIAYGVMLMGAGKFYLDDVSFEVVGKDVPTTNCSCYRKKGRKPRNLAFNNTTIQKFDNTNFQHDDHT